MAVFGRDTNFAHLHESLQNYTEIELFEGDNQYECASCGARVDAEKRCMFRKLPPLLTLSLGRITMNWQKGERQKVKSRYEFPMELDMTQYIEGGEKGHELYDLFSGFGLELVAKNAKIVKLSVSQQITF